MPSTLTLKKYIAKTKTQLSKQRNKLRYSKELKPKLDAKDEIERLESKLLYFEQQMIFEQVMSDVQRAKNTKGNVEEYAPNKAVSGCDNLGDECPW